MSGSSPTSSRIPPATNPSVHAAVSLFSSATGAPLASIDDSALTLLRMAAVFALAASLLLASWSRPPWILALAGAGVLAPYLAEAHLASLPSIYPGLAVEEVDGIVDEAVAAADVVSCATGSRAGPHRAWCRELVGAVRRRVLWRDRSPAALIDREWRRRRCWAGAAPVLGWSATRGRAAQSRAAHAGRHGTRRGKEGRGAERVEEEVAVDWWIQSWMWRERE